MARPKKEGVHLNVLLSKPIDQRLRAYADEKGQTLTVAVERLLTKAMDAEQFPSSQEIDQRNQ